MRSSTEYLFHCLGPLIVASALSYADSRAGPVTATGPPPAMGPPRDARVARVTVDPTRPGLAIPAGFLGLSHEWGQAQLLMGDPAIGVNPIYRQLLSNLLAHGGGPLSVRVGGSTTDRTGAPRPNAVTPLARLHQDLAGAKPGVSFILGVNLGANDVALATRQAQVYVSGMPLGSIQAIELGSQPDTYERRGYRAKGWGFAGYLRDFHEWTRRILAAVPASPRFMGPSNAGFAGHPPVPVAPPTDFGTAEDFATLLRREPTTLAIVSQHAYTGASSKCGDHPRPGFLLRPSSTTEDPKLAAPYVAVARAARRPYRVAEMNSIMCSGEPGISDAFEAALWVADILFEYAKLGVAGVNLHTNLWSTSHGWDIHGAFLFDVPERQYRASNTEAKPPPGAAFTDDYRLRAVLPLYYGLLFFAEATANQARLLPITLETSGNLKAWATYVPTSGAVRVAALNKDRTAPGTVRLTVPGYTIGIVKRLRAPSLSAKRGITFGGRTFDGSRDGRLVGKERVDTVRGREGAFGVEVGPSSAFLLTLESR